MNNQDMDNTISINDFHSFLVKADLA